VVDTLSTTTGDERISEETGTAEANRSVIASAVGARFAVGVFPARVRVTQVALVERAAPVERVAGETFRAAANGFVVLDAALGSDSAGSDARIHAFQVEAGLADATLFVGGTLGVATGERVAQEVGRARANRTVVLDATFSVGTAGTARILATEADTGAVRSALGVGLALVMATLDRIADESFLTRADCAAIFDAASRVGTARSRVTEVLHATGLTSEGVVADRGARDERITAISARATAHGHVVAHLALGIHSARRRARVDALEVVAHFVRRTFSVFETLGTSASGVWIALVSGSAGTDRAEAAGDALGVGSAGEAGAKIR